MSRVALVMPSETYRAPDFVEAARRLGAEVVVVSDVDQALAEQMGPRAVRVDLCALDEAAERILDAAPLDAVVAVDDQGVMVAAAAAERLALPHNPPDAVRLTRDKAALRRRLTEAGLPQPSFEVVGSDRGAGIPFPVVAKATSLSASRGVIRADDARSLAEAVDRVRSIVGDPQAEVIVEGYIPGEEVAVEGLLRDGVLEPLAIFDKPDPLEGPYFEETIYVTPSRKPNQDAILDAVERAVAAIGLREGPVHAELRLPPDARPVILEVAGRSIGGLCSRVLTFGLGMSLEELILRNALRRPIGRIGRERDAAGVMMLPIPSAGRLRAVDGRAAALEVPGIVGLEITAIPGKPIRPLPEGDRYLGFLFAKAPTPEGAEQALRDAHAKLDVRIEGS